jgi:hypothetical protein
MLQLESSDLILSHAWIDNQNVSSSDKLTFAVEDPAGGTILATLPDCGPVGAQADVDDYLQTKYVCLGVLGPA